jgi:3-isopropylmalate dehydratase small subunit
MASFNDRLRQNLFQKKNGKYISAWQLKTLSGFCLLALMGICFDASLSDDKTASSSSGLTAKIAGTGAVASSVRPAVLARVQYKDRMAAAATELNATDVHYRLEGADSTVITTTFDASVDDVIVEGYLTGSSREGFPLADAALKKVGFKASRVANAFGGIWERKVGRSSVKDVTPARSDAEIAASVTGIKRIPIALETGDGHHFNRTVPIFISKEAMRIAVRMIAQGMTDPDILAPYTSCVAQAGDSFVSLDGSWASSKVMLTDGGNRGCQGWTANEFIAKKR